MIRAARRLPALAVLLLAACAAPATRIAEGPRGGIGGTGAPPLAALAADAGVHGTVTGFGSILVNGLALEVAGREAPSPLGPLALAEGHVVEALVERAGGALEVRALAAVVALAGPLTAPPGGERLEVMGVAVGLEPGAPIPARLAAGERVAVSGLWRGEVLVASRVERLAEDAPDLVTALAGPGRIGPVPLAPGAATPEGAARVVAAGAWTAEGFRPAALSPAGGLLAAPLADLSVEAYLVERDGRLALSGFAAPLEASAPRLGRLRAGRAVFVGSWDGAFRIRHGVPLPEGGWARAHQLGRIGDGFAPARGALRVR